MTDFEKLQIAKLHNKKLQMELGVVQSERDELEFYVNQNPNKATLKKLRDENKQLRRTNSFLIQKLNAK